MKSKEQNIIYSARFDGDIFEYKARRWIRAFLWVRGLSLKVVIPINIVISYKHRKVGGFFHYLELTIHRYSFGEKTLHPIHLSPLLFFGRHSTLLQYLRIAMDNNMLKTQEGVNIGLMRVKKNKLKPFRETRSGERISKKQKQSKGYFLTKERSNDKQIQNDKSFSI